MTHYTYQEHAMTIVNIAVVGHGKVGSEFIRQLLTQTSLILTRKRIELRVFAIANSRSVILSTKGLKSGWEEEINNAPQVEHIPSEIIRYAMEYQLPNLILVDNTASEDIAKLYPYFASYGFDIVSSNKRANTLPWNEYKQLHEALDKYGRTYRYETNVGAGLPLIDNIKMLHLSGERISRIYGVFSGSLSYIFNTLGNSSEKPFDEIVDDAIRLGYAEPDAREDLCGEDVARKLIILARELDINCEREDVQLESLVPPALQHITKDEFTERKHELTEHIKTKESLCGEDEVLRYTGEVTWDDSTQQYSLVAKVDRIPRFSPIGSLTSADCCFEIYTESYGDRPIVVQGAGAGIKVTARGVFGDVLRIAEGKIKHVL